MSFKSALAVAGITATVARTAMGYLAPKTPEQVVQQRDRRQVSQLDSNEQRTNRELREQGMAVGDSDRRDRLRPVEMRPAEPRLRFRLPRLP